MLGAVAVVLFWAVVIVGICGVIIVLAALNDERGER